MLPRQNITPVYSLNYDFLPTVAYKDKCLWADLRWPAPDGLKIGNKIKFISLSRDLIPPIGNFRVSDIVGSRLVITDFPEVASSNNIKYFEQKKDLPINVWSPLDHNGHWGYATKDLANPNPAANRNWTYGNGQTLMRIVW